MVGIMLYGWYYAYIFVNTRLDSLDIVTSCSLSILMVGIMLIFPWISDSIVLIQCPRVAEVFLFLWLVLCLYFRGYKTP